MSYKGESEEYAQVIKILGDGRFECNCADGVKRIAHVRGKMRKRVWIANGDIILVSLREFEPEKCDVVEKYKEKEVAKLKKAGEIPETMVLPSTSEAEEKEDKNEYGDIIFEEQETDKVKKKDDEIDFGNEDEEEDEKKESDEEKNEKEDNKDNDEEEDEKEEEKEKKVEKTKTNKRDRKEKEKKIKKKRDDKKKGGDEDDKGINIDDI